MTTFSFSQVSSYLQCPRKYQFHYLNQLKAKEFETSYELLLGSLVHQTLEWLYQQIFPKDATSLFPSKLPTKPELLTYYHHYREKETKKQA
jgi:ATP-dependent helicase/DNAse subunit B